MNREIIMEYLFINDLYNNPVQNTLLCQITMTAKDGCFFFSFMLTESLSFHTKTLKSG